MSAAEWFAYVAFADDCRCIAAVTVDEPQHRKDVAKDLADWVKRGFVVERMTGAAFKEVPFRCPIHPDGRWPK